MRLYALPLLLVMTLFAAASLRPVYAAATPHRAAPAAALPQENQQVSSNDGTRVKVQVIVLCSAVVLVVVIGTGAYFLRKRLGLTAPPPKQDAGGHH
jgi:hypothetical protein